MSNINFECPCCFEEKPFEKHASCENDHLGGCQKCHINVIREAYSHSITPFRDDKTVQNCMICRQYIPDIRMGRKWNSIVISIQTLLIREGCIKRGLDCPDAFTMVNNTNGCLTAANRGKEKFNDISWRRILGTFDFINKYGNLHLKKLIKQEKYNCKILSYIINLAFYEGELDNFHYYQGLECLTRAYIKSNPNLGIPWHSAASMSRTKLYPTTGRLTIGMEQNSDSEDSEDSEDIEEMD